MSKLWKLISIALVLMLSLISACSHEAAPGGITDGLGRTVDIEEIPQRIVSLAPSNTEFLFALGLGDRVVGVTEHCNYPKEAKLKEKVGGYSAVDIEKVISLSPDLVLADSIHEKTVIPQLEEVGLVVFALNPKGLPDILQDITLVGEITGRKKQASQLVAELSSRIEAITATAGALPETQRPRVFNLTWHDPIWTSGSGTLADELIQKAGGVNIAHDATGYKVIDLEIVIDRNPEIIIACTGHGEAENLPFEWATTEPRLENIEARRDGRVYLIDADLIGRSGPRAVDALELLAWFIHPEIFR